MKYENENHSHNACSNREPIGRGREEGWEIALTRDSEMVMQTSGKTVSEYYELGLRQCSVLGLGHNTRLLISGGTWGSANSAGSEDSLLTHEPSTTAMVMTSSGRVGRWRGG